jgi:long-subunit fatty acid transport protein
MQWRHSLARGGDAVGRPLVARGRGRSHVVTGAAGTRSAPVTLETEFPEQLALGAWCELGSSWRAFADYSLTHYNRLDQVHVSTQLTGTQFQEATGLPAGGNAIVAAINASGIPLNWQNQSVYRLGLEYTALHDWILRSGYALTSKVVPNSNASPTYSSPGMGNDIVLGAGYTLNSRVMANVAFDYSFASGQGEAPASAGTYGTHAYIAHLGVNYLF